VQAGLRIAEGAFVIDTVARGDYHDRNGTSGNSRIDITTDQGVRFVETGVLAFNDSDPFISATRPSRTAASHNKTMR